MSELEYVKMLEVPVNSSEVIFKQSKGKKKDVKKRVIEKVNGEGEKDQTSEKAKKGLRLSFKKKPKKEKSKKEEGSVEIKNGGFDIVSMQVVTIFVLIVGIILTNIFFENSGMNRLMRSALSDESTAIEKQYSEFTALSPSKSSSVSLVDGVMTVESGSVYSPCDGVVESVVSSDSGYVVTVCHSDSFLSVISGLESVYVSAGDTVYPSIPVGYSEGQSNVSMFSDDAILTSYIITDERIEWLS
ncbi:MAG: hypothetical protein IJA97_01930 [Clostridia bacterium]|nr:hypothetical protein [Clostridia bacterium]